MVRNPPDNAGDIRDGGSGPGLGRSLEKEMVTHSSILAWEIPWTEEPGRLHTAHGVAKEWVMTKATKQQLQMLRD